MPAVPCCFDPEYGTYQILYMAECAAFYAPSTSCPVYENGLIDLPDGTKAPYTALSEFISGPDGYYQYVDGEFVLVEAFPPALPVVA